MKKKILHIRPCRIDGRAVITGTVTVFISGIIVRLLSGSPLPMLRISGLHGRIPPVWFFSLIWLFWYAFIGFIFGCVLGDKNHCSEVHKYKGCFWFVIMMLFNLVWYPLFFGAGAFFLALADLALILFFAVLSGIEFFKVKKEFGICIFMHVLWLAYCFTINAYALFSV